MTRRIKLFTILCMCKDEGECAATPTNGQSPTHTCITYYSFQPCMESSHQKMYAKIPADFMVINNLPNSEYFSARKVFDKQHIISFILLSKASGSHITGNKCICTVLQ